MSHIYFNREKLQAGDWLHCRSYSWLGVQIRKAQTHMLRRKYGRTWTTPAGAALPVEAWGNHDAIALPRWAHDGVGWGVGEALGQGNVKTKLEDWELEMNAAKHPCEVRVYRLIGVKPLDGEAIVRAWFEGPYKSGYDYLGILCYAWASYSPTGFGGCVLWAWNKTFGRKVRWCTEAINESYRNAKMPSFGYHGFDVCQDSRPAPFHVEAAALEGPAPANMVRRLVNVTDQVLVTA